MPLRLYAAIRIFAVIEFSSADQRAQHLAHTWVSPHSALDLTQLSEQQHSPLRGKLAVSPLRMRVVPQADGLDAILLGKDPVQETRNISWLQRLQDSFKQFIIGVLLFMFSIPVLWFNESRSAKMESLLAWGRSQCQTVSATDTEKENHYALVHVQGAMMKSATKVKDSQFRLELENNCIHLKRTVEVFQWQEQQQSSEKEKLGGDKETATTYTYVADWSSRWKESNDFHDVHYQGKNTKPSGLQVGIWNEVCDKVEYGDGFVLTRELIDQCTAWRSLAGRIGDNVTYARGDCRFNKHSDDYYYYSMTGNGTPREPEVGDARVLFQCVPDGLATVVALQRPPRDKEEKDSFLPYRLINRGWCGISPDDERKRLKAEGEKTSSQLVDEAGCGGLLGWCLCCACNLVMKCCAGAMTPEIHELFHGSMTQIECFKRISGKAQVTTWCLRVAGWFMMFIGLYFVFAPFLMVITALPFIGPFLSNLAGALIWFLCLVTTFFLASLIIVIAYLLFHPMMAFIFALAASGIIGGFIALCHHMVAG